MPRRQLRLHGPKDKPSQKRAPPKRKTGRTLNALSIAEYEIPKKLGVRRTRLGHEEEFAKRKRDSGREQEDSDDEGSKRRRTGDRATDSNNDSGSDSEGNRWKIGEVDSNDDSDLDSDEALGPSDEERFADFSFRGSSTLKSKSKGRNKDKSSQDERGRGRGRGTNLSGDVDLLEERDSEGNDDDLGDDAVDLTTAWDMNIADEEERSTSNPKRPTPGEGSEESDFEDGSYEASDNESVLSISDGCSEDGIGLSRLKNFVTAMDEEAASGHTMKARTSQEQQKPTEFGLAPSQKLTVADLLPSITDSHLRSSLKNIDAAATQKSHSSGVPGKLDVPLAKRHQDRLDREAAYKKSKETLDRWLETVKANRRADHLMFPFSDPGAEHTHKIDVAKPQTGLEATIQDILVESGLATASGKLNEDQLQEIEEQQTRKLPIEELQARRAELRKRRDLLFREEIRAKRIKKIKSKSYRRRHRKEQEKMNQQERQALIDAGVDLDEEEREQNERRRAEARMSSKHRDSKWAKSLRQTGRTAWDEGARADAADLAQREEELRKRIEGKRVSNTGDDYLSSSGSDSEENDPWEEVDSDAEKRKISKKLNTLSADNDDVLAEKGPHASLFSMKFMRNAEAARKTENDAEIRNLSRELNGEVSESEIEPEAGRQKFGQSAAKERLDRKSQPPSRNEFEELLSPSDEEPMIDQDMEIVVDRPRRKASDHSRSETLARPIDGHSAREGNTDENPWLVQTNRNNRRLATGQEESVNISIDESKADTCGPRNNYTTKRPAGKGKVADDVGDSDEDNSIPVLLRNHELVKRAFAGDEVVQSFEQEKLNIVEDEGDKVIDNTLPGWGSWTGEGISKGQKKRQQQKQKRFLTTVEGIKPESRKDAKLSRVIINEKRVRKNVKYLATQLPHPFETKHQYERSLRLPIGPEWSTKDTFQSSIKPRVIIKQGIIKPMERPMI